MGKIRRNCYRYYGLSRTATTIRCKWKGGLLKIREIYSKAKGLLEDRDLSQTQKKNLGDIVNLFILNSKR